MKKKLTAAIVLASLSIATTVLAQTPKTTVPQNILFNNTLPAPEAGGKMQGAGKIPGQQFFIENKGQWPREALYLARMNGSDVWITRKGLVYDFYKLSERSPEQKSTTGNPVHAGGEPTGMKKMQRYGQVLTMKFENGNASVQTEGGQKEAAHYNYFIGKDQTKFASNACLYKEVQVKNIYKGIDVRYYFENGLIRYDYLVQPGADVSQLSIRFEGSDRTFVNPAGDLVCNTRFGEVKQTGLYVYQEMNSLKKEVLSRFKQDEAGKISFIVGAYNPGLPLVIDPLIYSTFIGGAYTDEGKSIALDGSGNAYITGFTGSFDFPVTPGAYDGSISYQDVFVTKINSTGSQIIYSTFLGGEANSNALAILVDGNSNAYITGYTGSANFPTTAGAFDQTHNDFMEGENANAQDVFVTKLNSSGSALIYSTFLGGNASDRALALAIDVAGNAYITGSTASGNFPVTAGAFDGSFNGGGDIFVSKLNSSGSALIYSTYLGGVDAEDAHSIAVDELGNAYITGDTDSPDYPVTSGAFDESRNDVYYCDEYDCYGGDAFVTKFNSSGSGLVYSTLIGGSGSDFGASIAIDGSGNAYIGGTVSSYDFPVTPGAYDETFNGYYDVFVAKLNSAGTGLIFSSYVGGNDADIGRSIAIDASGSLYITGGTESYSYPVTAGAFMVNKSSMFDVFLTKLNNSGTALFYSSFIGGGWFEEGNSLAYDGNNIYITGYAYPGLPVTEGAFDITQNGYSDAFILKIALSPQVLFSVLPSSNGPVCAGGTVQLSVSASGGVTPYTYAWSGPNGFSSTEQNPVIIGATEAASGYYNVLVTAANGDESFGTLYVGVVRPPDVSVYISASDCSTGCLTLTATYAYSYLWSNGSTSNSITACTDGPYSLTASNSVGCTKTISGTIETSGTCPVPVNLYTTNITISSARLSWTISSCASGYEVRYRKQGTTTWTYKLIGSNLAYSDVTDLKRRTGYEWQIRSKCTRTSGDVFSSFSSSVFFSTTTSNGGNNSAGLTEPGEETDQKPAIIIYPNPVSDEAVMTINGIDGRCRIQVVNMLGQVVMEKFAEVKNRQKYIISTEALAQGVYKIVLINKTHFITGTFIKNK